MKNQNQTKNQLIIGFISIIAVLTCLIFILTSYFHDLHIVNSLINSNSKIIITPIGTIEYSIYGTGKPILISHGAGGGFDQGRIIAKEFFGKGYMFILPSRFGYLRSKTSLPITAHLQAEAYYYILRDIGISKVSVVGFSAGGPSALSFAANYPNFCKKLIMMSAISAPIVNSKNDPLKTVAFKLLFKSNFLYWSVTKVFRSQVLSLFGLTKTDQRKFGETYKNQINDIICTSMPASLIEPGVLNDQKVVLPSTREVETIKTPTLIFHVRQDPLISFRNAEYTQHHIFGSILVPLDYGGHFLLGHEKEIAAKTRVFLNQ